MRASTDIPWLDARARGRVVASSCCTAGSIPQTSLCPWVTKNLNPGVIGQGQQRVERQVLQAVRTGDAVGGGGGGPEPKILRTTNGPHQFFPIKSGSRGVWQDACSGLPSEAGGACCPLATYPSALQVVMPMGLSPPRALELLVLPILTPTPPSFPLVGWAYPAPVQDGAYLPSPDGRQPV